MGHCLIELVLQRRHSAGDQLVVSHSQGPRRVVDLLALARPECRFAQQQLGVVDAVDRWQSRLRCALVNDIDACDRAKGGVPIRHVHVVFQLRSTLRLRDRTAAHEGVHAHAALPIRHLATLQRQIACSARADDWQVVGWTSIVARDHNERVLPHAFGLELRDDLAHDAVHITCHGRVLPPVRILQETKLVLPGLGHLQGRVDQVEAVEQKEWLGGVVAVQDTQSVLREHLLDVGSSVAAASGPRGVPEVDQIPANVGLQVAV
mmetsp:Transcript_31017/g.78482  ORF Transcript_31017/g.78482 Transcript_31017/m.78482 type:complete len:263 (-) Transcript_31017:610-1398(-)